MSTIEEQEKLIEAIKRPDRYYRVSISGYGSESVYARISKEAYEYWSDEDCEYSVESYASDAEYFFEENGDDCIPPEADFLRDHESEEPFWYAWYDMPNELDHDWGVNFENAYLEVDEVESDEWNAKFIETSLESVELTALVKEHNCTVNTDEFDLDELADEDGHNYVLYFASAEKGGFFDGILHLTGGQPFDPSKLAVYTCDKPNGDTVVCGVSYNDISIDNQGGDTNGKGYYAEVWDY